MKNLILVLALLLVTSGCTCRVYKGAYVYRGPAPVVYHQPVYRPVVVQRQVPVQRVYQPAQVVRTTAPAPVVHKTVHVTRTTNVNVTRTNNVRVQRRARGEARYAQRSDNNKTMVVQPNAGRVQANGPNRRKAQRAYALAQRGWK